MMFLMQLQMEEEKLRELISVQELLDDEDEEAFNVCTKEGKKYNDNHVTLVQIKII